MSRLIPILALTTGCFYVDPINQRPSIDIAAQSGDAVFRGQMVNLTADSSDPEGQQIKFDWRVYACTDATTPDGCDIAPYASSGLPDITFQVHVLRADQPIDVTGIRVVLAAQDDLGATAKPDQVLVIPIGDQAPTLVVGKTFRPSYVANVPLSLFAKYGDPDDNLDQLAIDWHVFTPAVDSMFELTDADAAPTDAKHLQKAKRFLPKTSGLFDVQVTVTDPLGMMVVEHIPVDVGADTAPCIALYQPEAPLDLASPPLPMNAATLFSVPIVNDDLDGYPTDLSDPVFGTTQFAWSIQAPNATTFTPLAVAGNSVELDPASYTVGDTLELRVVIADRNGTTLACPESDLTCGEVTTSMCIQRLTWRVEIR